MGFFIGRPKFRVIIAANRSASKWLRLVLNPGFSAPKCVCVSCESH
jgi:hypothetical protein